MCMSRPSSMFLRKLCMGSVAVALSFSCILATSSVTSAGVGVNATNYSVSCTSITGVQGFNPRLSNTPALETSTFKAKLSGCTAVPTAGGLAVTIIRASIVGSFHWSSPTSCTALAGTSFPTGNLVVSWRTSPRLSSGPTVIPVASFTGEPDLAVAWVNVRGAPPATGSFQGTDGGSSDSIVYSSIDTLVTIMSKCSGPGVRKINMQPPQPPMSGPALSLG